MTIQEVMLFTRNLDVLYVEDDELLQFQTKHLFENFFNSCTLACNGSQALEIYKNKKFDIVITDIEMPEKNGIELIKDILKINKHQSILVTSAHDDINDIIPIIDLGVDGFLMKPFGQKEFVFSLFKSSKAIFFKQPINSLGKEHETYQQALQNSMDILETGVYLIENNTIRHANKHAHTSMFTNSLDQIQDRFNSLEKYLVKHEDCIYENSISDIIEKTKNSAYNKLMIKLPSGIRSFLFTCSSIHDQKYIISFRDITVIENAVSKLDFKKVSLVS